LPMKDGTLWIGTDAGLAFWNGVALSKKEVPPFLGRVHISALLQDRNGNIWISTPGGLARLGAKGLVLQEKTEPFIGEATTLFEDRDGNLWIGSAQGILLYQSGPGIRRGARWRR